jgi:hypothetical protein
VKTIPELSLLLDGVAKQLWQPGKYKNPHGGPDKRRSTPDLFEPCRRHVCCRHGTLSKPHAV